MVDHSNNDNQSNKLVNLSHILLSKIVSYLDENVDRIVFSLVCKRWFNERQRYLSFNTYHIKIINKINNKFIDLNSYKSIIVDQINSKTKCKVAVGLGHIRYYDHLIPKEELVDIDRLRTLNIDKVVLCFEQFNIGFGRQCNEKNKEYIKNLYRLISDLNISKFKKIQSFSALPMNITSLTLSHFFLFEGELEPGDLPPNLKTLKFNRKFNQPIKTGVLPNTLVKLNFNESFNQPLEPGVLPSSLKILKFKRKDQTLKMEHYLRLLEYYEMHQHHGYPQIKTLPNLKTLSISGDTLDSQIDLSCLPTSLTRLEIFAPVTLVNVMPPTIRYLDVECCDFEFDIIFKDRSLYQFDYLKLNRDQIASLDGFKIKELELSMSYEADKFNIPIGVETLSVPFISTFLHKMKIPSSVRKLIISNEIDCIDDLQKQYDFTCGGSIQELVIICNESSYAERIADQFQSIISPPNTLIKLTDLGKEIWIRMIDNQYYIVYCQSQIMTAIVHKSQLHKYLLYCITAYLEY
ncbi:hypothetical protein PPL_01944 [Heterostelium album PN500]|uniref:COI1 F-box domain-containing protein n=1 Tax=Heterostelium pallidum (strain ATCC 26659 / Pp 5 / PN500) TaxID=670386 RepID=D3B0X7_HETP5|nr:hypothetical protein PPL_01944 [Heterostelium album PN500]EFA84951.1 hypothetical protein PPL_01944 [Heterostelium album PN500]|eukprot:XP_020437061.1 hypothetical protein PPL_01944 [Heterostelium album PN500]